MVLCPRSVASGSRSPEFKCNNSQTIGPVCVVHCGPSFGTRRRTRCQRKRVTPAARVLDATHACSDLLVVSLDRSSDGCMLLLCCTGNRRLHCWTGGCNAPRHVKLILVLNRRKSAICWDGSARTCPKSCLTKGVVACLFGTRVVAFPERELGSERCASPIDGSESPYNRSLELLAAASPPRGGQKSKMSRAGTKKVLRRTWRTRGIRLNADTPLTDVEVSNTVLGSGSFGADDVRIATWCGAKVAAKTLFKASEETRRGSSSAEESSLDLRSFTAHQRRVLQECHLMGQLRHPNIAQVYGVCMRPDGSPIIVSELLGESLQQRLAFGTRLTYRDVIDVTLDVLQGLRYLHSLPHPLLHGSVCTSNVLFTLTGDAKLTDCNLALARLYVQTPSAGAHLDTMHEQHVLLVVKDGQQQQQQQQHGCEGGADGAATRSAVARLYLPLDALDHDCYDLGVDTYAVGMLLVAMLLHREPILDDDVRSGGSSVRQRRPLSNGNPERTRRAADLRVLAARSPPQPLVDLIDRCLDAVTASTDNGGDCGNNEDADTVDCGQERAAAHDLLAALQALATTDEYLHCASTRASPFARGLNEQADLALAVRRMEAQVRLTVDAARAELAEQELRLQEQVRELAAAHRRERGKLTERVKGLEAELNAVQNEVTAGERALLRDDSHNSVFETTRATTAPSSMTSPVPPVITPRKQSMATGVPAVSPAYGRRESEDGTAAVPVAMLRDNLITPTSNSSDEVDFGDNAQQFFREVHIKMPSGGLTTVQVDDRHTIGEIVQCLCQEHGFAEFEEYSLLLEDEDAFYEKAKKETEKTRKTFRGEKKLESIRRRWKGNDISSLNWLQYDKTLQEQGVDPSSQVLTMKKHTLTPAQEPRIGNVSEFDAEYRECKTAILDSSCPCTADEACTLAALQCHIQFGGFPDASKTKVKAIQEEIKDFLPKDFQKSKPAQRRVLVKYSENSFTMSQQAAQSRYISMCKSLPTYGATVFVVKTVAKSKSRLVAAILAITKEYVLKLDEKSKEVLHMWAIRNIKRWVATAEMIQIDIGEADPISLMTHDAQPIANLISMYKGIRRKAGREPSIDGGSGYGGGDRDPVYEEVAVKRRPQHATVTRSESTLLPRSPRMVQKRVASAEAPAFVSLATSGGGSSPKCQSPLLLGPRVPPKSPPPPPPTYDILEPGHYGGTPPPGGASEYLQASDVQGIVDPQEDTATAAGSGGGTLASLASGYSGSDLSSSPQHNGVAGGGTEGFSRSS